MLSAPTLSVLLYLLGVICWLGLAYHADTGAARRRRAVRRKLAGYALEEK